MSHGKGPGTALMDRLTDRRHKTAHCDVDVDVGAGAGAGPGRRRRGRGARLGGEIRAEIGAGIASARAEAAACGADPAAAEAAARPRIEDSRAAFLMRRDNEAPRWLKHQGAYVRALMADGADGRVAELAAAAAVGIVRWGGPSCRPGDRVAVTGELAMAMAGRGRRRRNSTHGPCGGCTGDRPGEVCVSMAGRTPGARAALDLLERSGWLKCSGRSGRARVWIITSAFPGAASCARCSAPAADYGPGSECGKCHRANQAPGDERFRPRTAVTATRCGCKHGACRGRCRERVRRDKLTGQPHRQCLDCYLAHSWLDDKALYGPGP